MHELSVAVALMERVEEEARRGGLTRVSRLVLELGALQAVEPDLLREAFAVVSEGGLADGAEILIERVEAQARCRHCGQTFKPAFLAYACPQCSQADAEILAGKDLYLKSLSGEAPESAEADLATFAGGSRP